MRKIRSQIADEIMREYFRKLRWQERIGELKKAEEQDKKENEDINNTR